MSCATILIADDDVDIRQICRMALEPKYEILDEPDGESAWKTILAKRPDLLLTDMVMPKLNGLDLIYRVREHLLVSSMLVIMMTGATEGEELPDGFWLKGTPADAFIQKPIELARLRSAVDKLFENRIRPRPAPKGGFM